MAEAPNIIVTPRRFRVAQGCSILLPGGQMLAAGTTFASTETWFTKERQTEWELSGHIERGFVDRADERTPNVPGANPMLLKTNDKQERGGALVKDGENPAIRVSTPNTAPHRLMRDDLEASSSTPPAPIDIQHSPWRMNPKKLAGKTLDQLNSLVLERDSDMTPFETVEEAVAQLSKDYQPPKSAAVE